MVPTSTTNCVKDVFLVFFFKPCAQAEHRIVPVTRFFRLSSFAPFVPWMQGGGRTSTKRRIIGHDTAYQWSRNGVSRITPST
jgi:hypothetical protein